MKGRRSIRLPDYDYSSPGGYFVTIATKSKESLFGEIQHETVILNGLGEIAEKCWREIPIHFRTVSLDAFFVMPNHIHGILFINELGDSSLAGVGATHASPLRGQRPHGPPRGSLGAIIGSYKSAVTREANLLTNSLASQIWHRNYFERVIRNERELNEIRNYVTYNALKDYPR